MIETGLFLIQLFWIGEGLFHFQEDMLNKLVELVGV